MRDQLSPFPLLKLAGVGLILALMNAAPAQAATATNAPAAAITNADAAPTVTPAPKKGDEDDEISTDGHSFKLNFKTKDDDKPESLTAQFLDNLIPLAGIAASFGTPILIVFFVCYFSYRRRQENVALAREYLAKGLPVPPELLDPNQRTSPYGRSNPGTPVSNCDTRRGFRLTFIGLAITVALFVDDPHSTTWGWGLIPTIMGIGYLLSGWYETRQENKSVYPLDKPPGDLR